ncbi:MAG: DUF6111 family protein [Rhodospirillaceae bacterium]
MTRILLTYIVPFLLPIAVYAAWVWYRTAYAARHGGEAPKFEKGPWPLLLFLGALLALAVMGAVGLNRGGDAGAAYEPARIEDGRIVPGRLESQEP